MANAADRLHALIAQRRAILSSKVPSPVASPVATSGPSSESNSEGHDRVDLPAGLDPDPYQDKAVAIAQSGKSLIITGPAGSGKSTTLKRVVTALRDKSDTGILRNTNHKYLRDGAPGIVICSFTNKAVENDKLILGPEYRNNCVTIHKLLEYAPEYTEGIMGSKQVFRPRRTKYNPLPACITTLVMEESTLTNIPLWNTLMEAIIHPLQIILVGDIQQLPPVFGKSILIHAMQRGVPIVELKTIHRQALESPIISLAHRILEGKIIPAAKLPEWSRKSETTGSRVQIRTWPKELSEIQILVLMQKWIPSQIDAGKYDPQTDMILTPFGKPGTVGSDDLNKIVAWHVAKSSGAEIWEIYTGIAKKYLRVGERVSYLKQSGRVIGIEPCKEYYGNMPRLPSQYIDYNGIEVEGYKPPPSLADGLLDEEMLEEMDNIDRMFESLGSHVDDDSPVSRKASHAVTIELDDGRTVTVDTAGDMNSIELGYARTVHKAIGSEWPRVMCIFHKSHSIAIYRELLYTAVTRASQELIVLCESNTFVKGIATQRLPGNTIDEKLASFERQLAKSPVADTEIPIKIRGILDRNTQIDTQTTAQTEDINKGE